MKSWKVVAAVLVAVVAVVALAVLRPWEAKTSGISGEGQGGENEGQPAGEEYVWVQYLASFKLLGTGDNGPIDEIAFAWPHPYIKYYTTLPQRENIRAVFLPGNSTENRGNILLTPPAYDNNWVKFSSEDNLPFFPLYVRGGWLYPNDGIKLEAWFLLPCGDISKLSLANLFYENSVVVGMSSPVRENISFVLEIELNKFENKIFQPLGRWEREDNALPQVVVKLYEVSE